MARGRQREQTIFFPWERGGGFLRHSRLSRAWPFAGMTGVIAFVLVLGGRERERAGIRATRATLGVVHTALAAYRADHERRCPPTLTTLKVDGYLGVDPGGCMGPAPSIAMSRTEKLRRLRPDK